MQKLFNNTKLKERFAETDHIVGGQVGQVGADNVTFENLHTQILGYKVQLTLDSDYTLVIPANSFLFNIFFKKSDSSPIVKIGSTNGADDIFSERAITTTDGINLITPIFSETSLYIGVIGGEVIVNCLYIENYF